MKSVAKIMGMIVVFVMIILFGVMVYYPHTFTIGGLALSDAAKKTDSAVESLFASPSTLTPLDVAAYNKKLLAIANIPPAPTASSTNSTSTTASSTAVGDTTTPFPPYSTAPGRAAIAALWPVKAPYPTDGAILPFKRIVAYYGNLYSTQMGVLGEYPSDEMLAMLASTTAQWNAADSSTPAVSALDYIAVTAQASAGTDSKYRARMPESQIDQIIKMANKINGLVILDVQVGLSNVETEVPLLKEYLKLPQVELALDPEFAMHDGKKPGGKIGTMDASDINWAARYLADLVEKNHLPPKILVVHRFTDDMVTNTDDIAPLPQVQIVMDMDGFGSPAKKISTYYQTIEPYPVQFTGFKLFYKNDNVTGSHMMSPQEVLRLSPQPSFIQYQ